MMASRHVVSYPGARRPDRERSVLSAGLRLSVVEWGPTDGRPVLLGHGVFDFARVFDVFAPLLAASGFRVVAWDQRGHGDSDRAHCYSWHADLRDAALVLASIESPRVALVGHSKAGALLTRLAGAVPHRVSHVVNIDGMQDGERFLDPDGLDLETVRGWLDGRLRLADQARTPATLDQLAERRWKAEHSLPIEWSRYLVTVGAEQVGPDLWRWKVDPAIRPRAFWPRRPEWSPSWLSAVEAPLLAVVAARPGPPGRDATPAGIGPYLPARGRMEMLDTGHFVPFERPAELAALVVGFLGS